MDPSVGSLQLTSTLITHPGHTAGRAEQGLEVQARGRGGLPTCPRGLAQPPPLRPGLGAAGPDRGAGPLQTRVSSASW